MFPLLNRGSLISLSILVFEMIIVTDNSSIVYGSTQEKNREEGRKDQFCSGVGSRGPDEGEFKIPYSTATDPFGNLFVTNTANDHIQKFTSSGAFLMQFGNKIVFRELEDIEIDSFNNIYVTDKGDSSIKKHKIA